MEQHTPHSSHTSPAKPKSVFDTMPSKFAFWAGFITAIALFSLVGLVTLGTVMLKGDDVSPKKTNTNTPTNTAAAVTNTAPTATGTVNMEDVRNIRGEGDLMIVEYSDLECPFCKRFHTTMQQVVQDYEGKVRWGYEHFPLTSLHPKATREAYATECAAEQEKFWEYTDLIYANTPSNNGLEDQKLYDFADEVGLDRAQFDDCLATEKYKDRVDGDAAEAQQLGGTGTPYSVVVNTDGEVLATIPGALTIDKIKATIDPLLQ